MIITELYTRKSVASLYKPSFSMGILMVDASENGPTPFGQMCRKLRKERGLKLRTVAEKLGVVVQTISNIECAPHRVVGEHRAIVLAEAFGLGPTTSPDRDSFMAAWRATPISKFSADRTERFKRLNEGRNARRLVPKLQYALCCLAGMHVGMVEDETKICVCEIGGDLCEVCEALSVLGLDAYSTREHAIDQLAALQGKLEAARAAAQNGATP